MESDAYSMAMACWKVLARYVDVVAADAEMVSDRN